MLKASRYLLGAMIWLSLAPAIWAADYTWVTGGYGGADNGAVWGAGYPANWTGNVVPVSAAGNSVSITNGWPNTASYTNTIQLRAAITLGTLDVDMSASNGVINRQSGDHDLIFDNSGNTAQLNGIGSNQLQLSTLIQLSGNTQFNVNGMSELRINTGISGNGELIITGNSTSNDVYFMSGTYTYTGNTRIESGALRFSINTTWSTGNIIANDPGQWNLTEKTTVGFTLDSTQSLSGNGTVATYSAINAESRALKSGGATISPGDFNIGTLTVTGAGLSLTGGNTVFEIGESSHDQIITNRLYLGASSSAGNIVIQDSGRTSTGNVALIGYSGTLTGSVSDLNLVLPAHWRGTLSDNTTNSTIDLNITKMYKYGTVFLIQ
jgi:hypothetical protein